MDEKDENAGILRIKTEMDPPAKKRGRPAGAASHTDGLQIPDNLVPSTDRRRSQSSSPSVPGASSGSCPTTPPTSSPKTARTETPKFAAGY